MIKYKSTKELKTKSLKLIDAEFCRAIEKHGPMKSAHEGYAVILEEMDELWGEIKKKEQNPKLIKKETLQIGAMVLRFLVDCCKL